MAYTTTDLLASIKRRAMLPDSNGALTDADLLSLATLAMRTQVQPLIRSVREDYAVVKTAATLTADSPLVRIPSRAEGGAVRDVWLRQLAAPARSVRLPYIAPEERPMYETGRGSWWDAPLGWTIEGNDIWLMPTPTAQDAATYYLELRYVLRPGAFVSTSDCMRVETWSPGPTTVVEVDSLGSYTTTTEVDVIGGTPPFRPRAIGIFLDSTSGGPPDEVTILPADYAGFIEAGATGDYICVTDTTCVVTCPVEAHEALISATLVEVYAALGYEQQMASAVAMRDSHMQAVRVLMEPRALGAARVVIDPRSPLRRGRRMGGW